MHDDILLQAFHDACNTPSDINEHVSTLASLAKGCRSVTEFGVRGGVSTIGFLQGMRDSGAVYTGYDLNPPPAKLAELAKLGQIVYTHTQQSTLTTAAIQPTDLLFIDTLHTHDQLLAELHRHGDQSQRWIVLHDTVTYGMFGEGGGWGLVPAFQEWLQENPHWKHSFTHQNNNGLTVMERGGA
jgi:predicted O-methyltransferase YrrM